MSSTQKNTEDHNLRAENENGTPSGKLQGVQPTSEEASRPSDAEVIQPVHHEEEQQSGEDSSNKGIATVQINENIREKDGEVSSKLHDRFAFSDQCHGKNDVVEIDLDDMGDELDFAEIGKHCAEFGRASFSADKKMSKNLISVDIDSNNCRKTVECKNYSEVKGNEREITGMKSSPCDDNVSDNVFLEQTSGSPHGVFRASEIQDATSRRKSMSDAKLHSSEQGIKNENEDNNGQGKGTEESAKGGDGFRTQRRKSTPDASELLKRDAIKVNSKIILTPNKKERNASQNPQNVSSTTHGVVDITNETKDELQLNLRKDDLDTPIFKIGNVKLTVSGRVSSPENSSESSRPRRSTPDLENKEEMKSEEGRVSEPNTEAVSSVSGKRPRRKSTSDANNYSGAHKIGYAEADHSDITELDQGSNLLSVHNNVHLRRKSDLVTIPEMEKESIEAVYPVPHQNLNGNVSDKNVRTPSVGGNDADSEQIRNNVGQQQVILNSGAHNIRVVVRRPSDADDMNTMSTDINVENEYELLSVDVQGKERGLHALPVYCTYTEEYLEEAEAFPVEDIEGRRQHVQITDLDDDEFYDVENDGGNGLEIDFDDLDVDVKEAFESIDNLSSGVSDSGSIRTRSSTFKIGDECPKRRKSDDTEYLGKYNYPRMSVADAEKLALKPCQITNREYDSLQHSKDLLSYKDVRDVSSSISENTEERRTIGTSLDGVDFGILKSVTKNLSKGTIRSTRSDSEYNSTLNRSRSHLISQSSDDIMNVRIYPPSEKWRILKNLIFISLAFMILFTAFNTTQTFQSSINSKRGLGSWSLVVYYFTLMVSNMFLPVIITKWLGCKGSMVASCLLFAPYIVAQFYPQFYTLLPTSAVAGMGAGVLFCAQGTYASVMAETYMTVSAVDKETTMMLFFGIFFFLYLMSLVWGNLISAQVLLTGGAMSQAHLSNNLTQFCGANFCPDTPMNKANVNLLRPSDDQLFIIWGILLALVFVAAAVLVIGVDSLSRYNENERATKRGSSGCQLLAASIKHLGNPYQLLLIPVSAMGSVSEGFLEADYTYSYIACAWGIPYIGYVMICYGILLLLFTLLLGCFAVRVVGRLPLMLVCFTLYLGVLAALKFWAPNPEENIVFFIIAGFWGIADASTVIITAMYGIVFLGNEEAAFCNLGISRALGYLLSYMMHPLLCMDIKMIIVLVIVLVAAAGYITFEHLWRKASKAKAMASLVPFKGWVDVPVKSQPKDEG